MDHQLIRRKLLACYDEELSVGERQEIIGHLQQCSECSAVYAQWQRTAALLFRAPEVHPSEALVNRVLDALPETGHVTWRPPELSWWAWKLRWLVPAGSVAVLLSLVLRPVERTVSVDTLLLSENQAPASSQLLLARDMPSTDDVWHVIMEVSE